VVVAMAAAGMTTVTMANYRTSRMSKEEEFEEENF
jgi:hypothetical protein